MTTLDRFNKGNTESEKNSVEKSISLPKNQNELEKYFLQINNSAKVFENISEKYFEDYSTKISEVDKYLLEFHQEVFPVSEEEASKTPTGLMKLIPARIRKIITPESPAEKKENQFSALPTKEKVQEFKSVYKDAVVQLEQIVPAVQRKQEADENSIKKIESEIQHFESFLEDSELTELNKRKVEYHLGQKENELQLAKVGLKNTRDQGEALIITAQQLLQRAESTFRNINDAILSAQITNAVSDSIRIGKSATELSGQMLSHATSQTTNMVNELLDYASTAVVPQEHLEQISSSMDERSQKKEGAAAEITQGIVTSLRYLEEIDESYKSLENSLLLDSSSNNQGELPESE